MTGSPPAFHLLVKPAGARCNLACTYCFYLAKADLYPGGTFRMSDEMLDRYLQQLIGAHRTREVPIVWQGGEPTLMGLDFYRRAVERVQQHLRPGQRAVYGIQTNGVLIDDAWAAFFAEHGFLVGLSVDGPAEVHDTFRVDRGGAGTFGRVQRGWKALQRHKVDTNVLCTVHTGNASRPHEVYRFLRDDLGAEYLQFIPIVDRHPDGSIAAWSVSGYDYGRFLIEIFEEWVRRDVGRVYIQLFDVTLEAYLGRHTLCVHAPTCGYAVALEHTGDLYYCDHFVDPEHHLGNLADTRLAELLTRPELRAFDEAKSGSLPRQCRDCDVRFLCHGGCPKDRFAVTASGEPGLNHLCDGYRAFFHHADPAMRYMLGQLANSRAPAEIMDHYAREDARRGRNDPCSCGSGQKFKHCHDR